MGSRSSRNRGTPPANTQNVSGRSPVAPVLSPFTTVLPTVFLSLLAIAVTVALGAFATFLVPQLNHLQSENRAQDATIIELHNECESMKHTLDETNRAQGTAIERLREEDQRINRRIDEIVERLPLQSRRAASRGRDAQRGGR